MKRTADKDELEHFQSIGLAANRVVLNLIKLREFPEMLDGAAVVSDGRFQRSGECSEVNVPTIVEKPRDIAAVPVSVDALEPSKRRSNPFIGVVLGAARFPQIRECIVVAPAIDMVDQHRGPFASTVQPRETGRLVKKSINANDAVPMKAVNAAGNLPYQVKSNFTTFPSKKASFSVVVESPFKPFQGQRSGTFLVRHFSGLNEEKNENSDSEKNTRKAPDQRTSDSAADIERRVKDILAMENRLRRKTI